MWGRMEIRGVGAGPAVGIRRGGEFILFAAPVVSSEAESPRPEPPRRLRGALLLSPFLGRQEKVSMSDFPSLFYELIRLNGDYTIALSGFEINHLDGSLVLLPNVGAGHIVVLRIVGTRHYGIIYSIRSRRRRPRGLVRVCAVEGTHRGKRRDDVFHVERQDRRPPSAYDAPVSVANPCEDFPDQYCSADNDERIAGHSQFVEENHPGLLVEGQGPGCRIVYGYGLQQL